MNIFLKTLSLLIIFTFLTNCAAIRSGKGLSKGELNIGYTAPLAGSVRYGITNNIESRFSVVFESYNFDLYFHTHSDSNLYNYGVTIGSSYLYDRNPYYFGGITIDRKLNSFIYPYFSYIIYSDFNDFNNQLSVGSEIKFILSKKKKIVLLIIPEVSYLTKDIEIMGSNTNVVGLINIGLLFDLK